MQREKRGSGAREPKRRNGEEEKEEEKEGRTPKFSVLNSSCQKIGLRPQDRPVSTGRIIKGGNWPNLPIFSPFLWLAL